MSAKEKGKFEDMAKADKACYEREIKTYIASKRDTSFKKEVQVSQCTQEASFGLFLVLCLILPKIKGEHPCLFTGDVAKKLGVMWNNTAADDKQTYEKKATKLKEKYKKDITV